MWEWGLEVHWALFKSARWFCIVLKGAKRSIGVHDLEGGVVRCGEVLRDVGRCEEVCKGVGWCEKVWGGVGRCGEM